MPQLGQCLGFDLADALARNVELLTDLLQGVLAITADPISPPNHLLFLGRERLQNARRLIANVGNVSDNGVSRPRRSLAELLAIDWKRLLDIPEPLTGLHRRQIERESISGSES